MNLAHLVRLTDANGIARHATLSVPQFSEGYGTDDNVRAFILATWLEELEEKPALARTMGGTYAGFLKQAFNQKSKRFHNVLGFDRRWRDGQGSEDSHARVLWALGTGVGRSSDHDCRSLCSAVFKQALPAVAEFASSRAWAFALLGMHEYLQRPGDDQVVAQMRDTLTSRLLERFTQAAHPDWHWFEDVLAQENATLAHALIASGSAPGQKTARECGLHALEWLLAEQTAEDGHFRPIGTNGIYRRGGRRPHYDQKPIEVQAMVSACMAAYRVTAKPVWHERAQNAFDWFLGWNDLGLELYSATTGGCGDALQINRADANQGAEATLAFLLSLAEMRSGQHCATVSNSATLLTL
jgi:hypothetical protein